MMLLMRPLMERVASRMNGVFQQHPYIANACTGAVLFGGCDLAVQGATSLLEDRKHAQGEAEEGEERDGRSVWERMDWKRAVGMTVLGFGLNGFGLYPWYRLLDRVFSTQRTKKVIIAKCIADEVVYAPISISIYLSWTAALKADSFEDWKERTTTNLKLTFWRTLMMDCIYWPGINFVGFGWIPIHLRPSFIGVAQVASQLYLAAVGHRNAGTKPAVSVQAEAAAAAAASVQSQPHPQRERKVAPARSKERKTGAFALPGQRIFPGHNGVLQASLAVCEGQSRADSRPAPSNPGSEASSGVRNH